MNNIHEADKYRNFGELSLAEYYYKMAIKESDRNLYAWFRLLEVSFMQGKKNQVNKIIGKMKIEFPDIYYPYHIEFIMKVGEYDDGIEEFLEKCKDKFNDNINYHYDRFIYFSGIGNSLKAIGIAKDYLISNKKMFIKIAEELADTYISIEDYDNAKEILKKAYNTRNNDIFLIKLMGIYMHLGDEKSVEEYCEYLLDGDEISKVAANFIKALVEKDEILKKREFLNLIYECKSIEVDYPVRIFIDILIAVSYYFGGETEKSLEQLNFIDNISDGKIEEISELRKVISSEELEKSNEMESLELYIFDKWLQRYMDYIR